LIDARSGTDRKVIVRASRSAWTIPWPLWSRSWFQMVSRENCVLPVGRVACADFEVSYKGGESVEEDRIDVVVPAEVRATRIGCRFVRSMP
jgi:hypothetical protein